MYYVKFQNKQWVIKKLNQKKEERSESLTTKSVQMNTLAQYTTTPFQEAAEKASISFHFGETFYYKQQRILWKNRFN